MAAIITIRMPDIGEGVVEGEVIQWLKSPGEIIKKNEPVVVVMTDKATVELPSPYQGKLAKQYYQPGEVAFKDRPLYDIETEEVVEIKGEKKSKKTGAKNSPQLKEEPLIELPKSNETKQALALPSVRKLAKELSISLENVNGTGKEGRITLEDLKRHVNREMTKPSQERSIVTALNSDEQEIVPLVGIRHLMVKKMEESHKNIPSFSFFETADATRLIDLKQKTQVEASKENIKLTYMPFLIRALSLTIKKFPIINSALDQEGKHLIMHKNHNIGIAISTPQGLIVPVLKDVDKFSLADLIRAYEELKAKALTGKLTPQQMKGGTISISNFGVFGGGAWATPVILFPEVAILAIAKIGKQPFVKGGDLVVRDALNLSWSFDHRVIDGDTAAHVSNHYSYLIQNPLSLIT